MSMTVTATQGGATGAGMILTVKVLTGQAASPIGASGNSAAALQKAITPAGTGSWVYVTGWDIVATATADAATTLSGSELAGGNGSGFTGRSTATTTAGTPVTVGITETPSSPGLALLEILAGAGLVEDASAPAVVKSSSATTLTTAAFTPPAGSLLVVMASCDVGGVVTLSITNTGGLSFTSRSAGGGAGQFLGEIWTAPVPGVGVALGTAGLTFAALPLVPSAQSGTVPLGTAGLTFAAHPLAVSAGTHTTALGTAGLTLTAQPLAPVVLSPFPRSPLRLKAELLLAGTWTDITGYVYFSDKADSVDITGGRPDESGFVNPSTLGLTVNNNDGRFSPKNAAGPWFGEIGRNTQIRVSVQAGSPFDGSSYQYRAWQEVAEWPFQWDPVDIGRRGLLKGAGVLRRLQASGSLGTAPANLTLPYTAFVAALAGTSLAPIAWWPCTEAAGATQFASGISSGPPMAFSGTPGFAADSAFPGSAALPTFGKSVWTALLGGATLTPGGTSLVTDQFFSSTTWTCPPGVFFVQQVTSVGSGGGGSGGSGGGLVHGGSGGGGGGITPALNVAVTPGSVYVITVGGDGGVGAPNNGPGGDGGDSSFPGDSVTVTGGKGSGAPSQTSGGAGGSGTFPGADGTPGALGGGGGGGGAGSGPGPDGAGANGGGNGGNGGAAGSGGANGNSLGGGGGGAGGGSTTFGGFGAFGMVELQYQLTGGGNVTVAGGPQNANVIRFLLDVPAAGDVDGAVVLDVFTSGTAARLQVFYHAGIAILSGALGAGAITAIAVNPTPEDIPSGTVITVTGSTGSQQFTTSSDAPTGSTSISIVSSTATITTAAGDVITKGLDPPGYLQLFGLTSSNGRIWDSGLCAFGANGNPMLVSVELVQAGANVNWTLQALMVGEAVPVAFTGTGATVTVGSVGALVANSAGELDGTAAGQFTVQYATSPLSGLSAPLDGYAGETAGNRFLRLCAQQGIAAQVTGSAAVSVPMGPQPSDTFVNLVQDCETADMGLVFEPRNFLGLGYRTRASMLTQAPAADLDYATFALPDDPPLAPTYDDQFTSNDITVSRTGGSSLEVTQQGGRLSVQAPPAGVGQYASSVDVNLFADNQLPDVAGWLLHRSTVDEYRFPTVAVRAEYAEISETALFGAVSAIGIGDFVQVSHPPSWLTPDSIRQLVYGFTETIRPYSWVLAWNAVPESPYEVALSDVSTWRADTTGSTLVTGVSSAAVTLSVATTAAGAPLWDTAGGDMPFDIVLNGERMTVTAITGSTSPQSFAVARAVNGVVKAHLAGEAVALFNPPIASL